MTEDPTNSSDSVESNGQAHAADRSIPNSETTTVDTDQSNLTKQSERDNEGRPPSIEQAWTEAIQRHMSDEEDDRAKHLTNLVLSDSRLVVDAPPKDAVKPIVEDAINNVDFEAYVDDVDSLHEEMLTILDRALNGELIGPACLRPELSSVDHEQGGFLPDDSEITLQSTDDHGSVTKDSNERTSSKSTLSTGSPGSTDDSGEQVETTDKGGALGGGFSPHFPDTGTGSDGSPIERALNDDTGKILPTVAEIICSLTPSVLATLVIIQGSDHKTQEEIASELGWARSTLSKNFRSLANLPLPLIDTQADSVVITEHGERIIEVYRSLLSEFDIDIESVNWSTDEIAVVEDALSPLYKFQSHTPFLILGELVELSSNTEDPIWVDDLIIRLETLTPRLIDSISEQHFEQILSDFEQHETIRRDGEEIELTGKGQHQGNLLNNILSDILLEDNVAGNQDPETKNSISAMDSAFAVSSWADIGASTNADLIANPDAVNAFRGGSFHNIASTAEVGPVACVDSGNGPQSVGPIRGTDPETLAETLRAIASELEDIEEESSQHISAGIFRCLVHDDEIVPLGDDWQRLEAASFAEWHMINKAFRLIDQQDP